MNLLLPPGNRRSAFSVIELIVALLVVAVLAAVLFGAVGKVRDQTKPTRELATLRTIGATLHLYLAENRGVLPNNHKPVVVKTLAHYLGYTSDPNDWSNDSATPNNSIFRNGADEASIRRYFASAYDSRENPDPLNGFATNESIGQNPNHDPAEYDDHGNVRTYLEIKRPSQKIYMIPTWFMPRIHTRFAEATTTNPFRTARNPADKGHFPALFADGHVEMVDPAPKDMTLHQINHRWIRPKHD